MTYASLLNIFEKAYKWTVQVGCFSKTKTGKYIRSLHQQSLTFNTNYFYRLNADVEVSYDILINNHNDSILTNEGKLIYNNGNNPLFETMCGGHVFTSGKLEYLLTFNIAIQIENSENWTQIQGDASEFQGLGSLMNKLNQAFNS